MINKRQISMKDYIAKNAIDVFASMGYKEASLENIANKCKLSKAGIYHYFKSKSEILSYILFQNTENGLKMLEECNMYILEEKIDPLKAFDLLIRTYANVILTNKKVSLLILRERHQLNGLEKDILTEKERKIYRLIRDALKKISNINKEINFNLASFHVMSMIHWMGYWYNDKGTLSKDEAINQTVHLIFHGILENFNGVLNVKASS